MLRDPAYYAVPYFIRRGYSPATRIPGAPGNSDENVGLGGLEQNTRIKYTRARHARELPSRASQLCPRGIKYAPAYIMRQPYILRGSVFYALAWRIAGSNIRGRYYARAGPANIPELNIPGHANIPVSSNTAPHILRGSRRSSKGNSRIYSGQEHTAGRHRPPYPATTISISSHGYT
jgi:hypothetical protein